MVRVPFLDVAAAYAEIHEEIDSAVSAVHRSGRYLLGDELNAFEAEFAAHVGARHCVAVGSGLDALVLALHAFGVGPGCDVIVPGATFIATWLAVSHVGANPVPVEPDPNTYNINVDRLADQMRRKRPHAIIPVHLYGQPAEMSAIMELGRHWECPVIADAAQAHGARYQSQPVGKFGDASAWSFYPAKNLGALGDGGAVTTDSDAIAARLRLLRNYGASVKYRHQIRGFNSRLDEIQSAVLRIKLRHLARWNDRRQKIAARYLAELRSPNLSLPVVHGDALPSWHLFVIACDDRDQLQERLALGGVETIVHYPVPPHLQPAYADMGLRAGSLPIAERIHRRVLSLPIGPHMAEQQVDRVIEMTTLAP